VRAVDQQINKPFMATDSLGALGAGASGEWERKKQPKAEWVERPAILNRG